jgi:hypothetical protein
MNWSLMKTDTFFFPPFFLLFSSIYHTAYLFYACLLAYRETCKSFVKWVCLWVCVYVCVRESGLLGGCCWLLGIWQGPVCACFSWITENGVKMVLFMKHHFNPSVFWAVLKQITPN